MGINIGPLLAGAGVIALAVGFGAQTLANFLAELSTGGGIGQTPAKVDNGIGDFSWIYPKIDYRKGF
jgi:hypothetical protein